MGGGDVTLYDEVRAELDAVGAALDAAEAEHIVALARIADLEAALEAEIGAPDPPSVTATVVPSTASWALPGSFRVDLHITGGLAVHRARDGGTPFRHAAWPPVGSETDGDIAPTADTELDGLYAETTYAVTLTLEDETELELDVVTPEAPETSSLTLDLSDPSSQHTPYPSSTDPGTLGQTLSVVTDGGVQKQLTTILGATVSPPSRNGARQVFGSSKIGGARESICVTTRMKFRTGFKYRTFGGSAGGKMGTDITFHGEGGRISGGGYFFSDSVDSRITHCQAGDANTGRLKLYLYAPYYGHWMQPEAAIILGGVDPGDLAWFVNCQWNHWQIGGDRGAGGAHESATNWRYGDSIYPGASIRPLWQSQGPSRFVGFFHDLLIDGDGAQWTYPVGSEITIEMWCVANTFHSSNTFDGALWLPGIRPVPNKDGVLRIRARVGAGSWATLVDADDVVWRLLPGKQFDTLYTGGAAGGPYEGCQGTFEIYNVEIADAPA